MKSSSLALAMLLTQPLVGSAQFNTDYSDAYLIIGIAKANKGGKQV